MNNNLIDTFKFDEKTGLIPVITQCYKTNKVLMLAYANKEAILETIRTQQAHYWSRSRQNLWHKGATSGHYQNIQNIYIDCDQDTVLYIVEQIGVACHTGELTCFFTKISSN